MAPGQLSVKQKNNNIAQASANTVINQVPADNLDKLKKLKGLLDAGAITQAEYDVVGSVGRRRGHKA
ncbi:MAG TPA: SHOCT domain-containing protein [Flavitalea sp.]|nr:SHOCT domain-containing protein [Mucilaginibacter sp.]HTF31345.1 SHOCT domain-containing protein [Flavitalea sp.]